MRTRFATRLAEHADAGVISLCRLVSAIAAIAVLSR
jgi:hypothetical protein